MAARVERAAGQGSGDGGGGSGGVGSGGTGGSGVTSSGFAGGSAGSPGETVSPPWLSPTAGAPPLAGSESGVVVAGAFA